MIPVNDTPSDQLLKAFRARLVLGGSSMAEWARVNEVKRQNLAKALTGEWQGEKAAKLVQAAIDVIKNEIAS
ncbi:MAG: hypothetical protein K8F59_10240 [Rhodobacteraceae bacterium]|nr:hypothetical protein [Paracoccaceae bacterium]